MAKVVVYPCLLGKHHSYKKLVDTFCSFRWTTWLLLYEVK